LEIGHDIRAAFREQARACRELGSPFTSKLCDLFATRLQPGDPIADQLLQWRATKSASQPLIALRVAGALHGLVLEKRCVALTQVYPPAECSDELVWQGIADAMHTHATYILDRLTSAPQTNEVRRAAILVPVFWRLRGVRGCHCPFRRLVPAPDLICYGISLATRWVTSRGEILPLQYSWRRCGMARRWRIR